MAKSAAKPLAFPAAPVKNDNASTPVLAPVVEIDLHRIGRKTTQAFPGIHAPEGWVKKEDRQREGKVWVGYFHLWTEDPKGIVNLSGLGTFVTAQSVVSRWSQRAVTVRHTEKDRDRKNR